MCVDGYSLLICVCMCVCTRVCTYIHYVRSYLFSTVSIMLVFLQLGQLLIQHGKVLLQFSQSIYNMKNASTLMLIGTIMHAYTPTLMQTCTHVCNTHTHTDTHTQTHTHTHTHKTHTYTYMFKIYTLKLYTICVLTVSGTNEKYI